METDYNFSTGMNFAWKEGGFLVLKELSSATSLIPSPLSDWTIRGLITEWQYNKFDNITSTWSNEVRVEIEVVLIDIDMRTVNTPHLHRGLT